MGPAKKKKRQAKEESLQAGVDTVKKLLGHVAVELGHESERHIHVASESLKEEKRIIDFYNVSSIKKLDKRGIDFIYQTRNGFYLVQVKSSERGAEAHRFKQSIGSGPIIYVIVRHSGQDLSSLKNNLSRIFREEPSLICLPAWIEKALGLEVLPPKKSFPKKKRQEKVRFLKIKQRTESWKKHSLGLADASKLFSGIKGVKRVRVVIILPESKLTERHIEVVCWTKKGIYLFDFHRKDVIEEGGIKIFPLDLSWPKDKIREMLKEETPQTFPLSFYGSIMDLE